MLESPMGRVPSGFLRLEGSSFSSATGVRGNLLAHEFLLGDQRGGGLGDREAAAGPVALVVVVDEYGVAVAVAGQAVPGQLADDLGSPVDPQPRRQRDLQGPGDLHRGSLGQHLAGGVEAAALELPQPDVGRVGDDEADAGLEPAAARRPGRGQPVALPGGGRGQGAVKGVVGLRAHARLAGLLFPLAVAAAQAAATGPHLEPRVDRTRNRRDRHEDLRDGGNDGTPPR
jgi:hypothetical protein